jgi:hypothetical protein
VGRIDEVEAATTAQQTQDVLARVRKVSKPRQLQIPSGALRRGLDPGAGESGRAPLLDLLERGEVRFKLYLWLRWLSQHSTDFEPTPIRLSHLQWALLLGLADPAGGGVKRVGAAMAQLEQRELVNRSPERPAAVKPTNVAWWPVDRDQPKGGYAALPVGFFTEQWIGGLSGRALATLLILIDRANPRINMPSATLGPPTYVAESVLNTTYGISEDLYRPGRKELEAAGLVTSRLDKRWSGQDSDWRGVESTLNAAKLRDEPHPHYAAALTAARR